MNEHIGSLETKVERIIALCAALRTENHQLRGRVVELEDEKLALAGRMTEARGRLETLMDRLPAE